MQTEWHPGRPIGLRRSCISGGEPDFRCVYSCFICGYYSQLFYVMVWHLASDPLSPSWQSKCPLIQRIHDANYPSI